MDPLQDDIHAGIPIRTSAIDRMANSMCLPCFCLCKLAGASVTSMTGSSCRSHGRKLVLGANAMRKSWPSSIAEVSTLRLPVIFLWEEKLVASLIATPNVDNCKYKTNKKENRARLHAMHIILMQNEYYSFCKQLGRRPSTNTLWVEKRGNLRWE